MTIVDHVQLVHDAGASFVQTVSVLAAEPSPSPVPAPVINTTGVVQFLATKIAPILLAVVGSASLVPAAVLACMAGAPVGLLGTAIGTYLTVRAIRNWSLKAAEAERTSPRRVSICSE